MRALLGVLLIAACPGPQPVMDAGVDAGPMFTVVEACDVLAAAKCELYGRCYAAFNRDATDNCRTAQQSRCLAEYDALKDSFETNKVKIDPQRVLDCQARMMGSSCPPSFPPDYFSFAAHPFSDCSWQTGLLVGQLKSMGLCKLGVDCGPGLTCVKPNGVCEGTCSGFSAEAEPCAFGCGPGLRCDDKGTLMDTNDDVCAPLKLVNEPCKASSECSPELVCNVTCRPRGKENEACRFDVDRLSTCDPGLACDVVPYVDGAIGTCIRPKDAFEACRFHWSCKPGLVCADIDWSGFPDVTPGLGSCRAPGDIDTNCLGTIYSAYVGDPCKAGAHCSVTLRKCLATPTMSGDMCDPSAQNCSGVGLYCKPSGGDTGFCAGPAGQGDRCAFQLDATRLVTIPCSSGFCDTESTLTCRSAFKGLESICKEDGECQSGRCAVRQDRSLRCSMACN